MWNTYISTNAEKRKFSKQPSLTVVRELPDVNPIVVDKAYSDARFLLWIDVTLDVQVDMSRCFFKTFMNSDRDQMALSATSSNDAASYNVK
jgi:hypothetical protein